jgi:hypothetical protein
LWLLIQSHKRQGENIGTSKLDVSTLDFSASTITIYAKWFKPVDVIVPTQTLIERLTSAAIFELEFLATFFITADFFLGCGHSRES